MYSARGVGALVGPLCCGGGRPTPPGCTACSPARWPSSASATSLIGITGTFWLVLVLLTVAHAGGGANWILSTYGLQAVVPDALRGRVFSADYTLATLIIAVSQVAFGLLSDVVAARDLLAASGGIVLLYAGGWWMVTRRLRDPAAVVAAVEES